MRAVIWDVDGTLVDTAELHFEAWVKLAQEIGKPYTRADFAATFGWRNPEIIPKLFGSHYSLEEVDALGRHKENIYRKEAQKGVDLLPGVRDLVEALHHANIRQAIGSSAPRDNLAMILELTGTKDYFEYVVGLEDTARGKPDPEVFLRAARGVGVDPSQCVVLEDAPAGIQGARAAGMKAVGVTFVGHHSAETLERAGAHLVTPTLESIEVQTLKSLFP